MKTSELIGPALDWAVAKAQGLTYFGAPEGRTEASEFRVMRDSDPDLQFSTNWAQGGPIIERERMLIRPCAEVCGNQWVAKPWDETVEYISGPNPLIAAMRCFVASKLGDEVEIPEELC